MKNNEWVANYYYRVPEPKTVLAIADKMGIRINEFIAARIHSLALISKAKDRRYEDVVRKLINRSMGR